MSTSKNNLSFIKLTKIIAICVAILLVLIMLWKLFLSNENHKITMDAELSVSVKVTVVNGCGYKGIAYKVKQILVDKYNSSIDVIEWRNSDKFIYEKSILVMKKKNQEKLNHVSTLTGITRRTYAIDSNALEDVQIILGKDYAQFFKKE